MQCSYSLSVEHVCKKGWLNNWSIPVPRLCLGTRPYGVWLRVRSSLDIIMSFWRWLVACGCAVGVTTIGWKRWKSRANSPTARLPAISECRCDSSPVHAKSCSQVLVQDKKLWRTTERSRLLVKRAMLERGIPGAVVAVSKNGEVVWSEGFGYADIENDVYCSPDTVMRIGSISKPLTAVALLQLWQEASSRPGCTCSAIRAWVPTKDIWWEASGYHYKNAALSSFRNQALCQSRPTQWW